MKDLYRIIEKKWQIHILIAVLALAAATVLGHLFRRAGFPDTNVVLVYILAVLVTSCLTKGYWLGLSVSVAATLVFNYFFTAPYYSLDVYDPSYIITFFMMTMAALVSSTLTSKVKQNALEAMERETETQALYKLTSRLTEAKEVRQVSVIVEKSVKERLACRVSCICFDEGEKSSESFTADSFDRSEEVSEWPIRGEHEVVGVLLIPKSETERFKDGQKKFLSSLIECTALAADRIISSRQQMLSKQEMIQERYRANLLRAISHDLRTPLTGIMGTSEIILGMTDKSDPRHEMLQGILKDTEWLHSLVENILSLTRIQEGHLEIHKVPEAVEEIVEGAIARISASAPEYQVVVKVPEDVLMIPMDGKLIMQVLINLLDNALKHCSPDQQICVAVDKDDEENCAVIKVSDRGEGISPSELQEIFEAFYTTRNKSADAKKGIGLGLAICESIVKAHGGVITACNRTDGPGAEFMFTLPLADGEE